MGQPYLTIGQVAARFGLQQWHVRELCKRGFLPEPPRVGSYRVFREDQLPEIETALRKAKYLKPEGAGALA